MVEKEAPASTALTVSDSTRTPTRNICSRPMMRTRSTTSSSERPLRNDGGDHGLDFAGAGQGIEEARIQHRIQHARAGAQLFGQARCGSQDGGDEVKQIGIGLQHGKKLNPGGKPGDELVKGEEGQVRFAAAGQRQ